MTTTTTVTGQRRRAARHARVRAALPGHLERRTWDAERLAAWQRDRLRALLRHAKAHSRFHAERLAGVDPARFELADLPSLPTMTKAEMMAGLDRLLTDPGLSLAVLEEHLAASTTEATELLGEYVVLASGGSSGERGVFVYGADAIVDYLLGLVRNGVARLLSLGERPPAGCRWRWSPPARRSTPPARWPTCSPATCWR